MFYNHKEIDAKWQQFWKENQTFKAKSPAEAHRPKYYALDMFPYPSGAGLHVGHPLGYIASDIYSRYKRHQGFNVLHPIGYDSFGLPAEQYAIQTGQHPAITTEENIKRYEEQLRKIGFSFDWDRELRTSNPDYYKWTQWIFIQLFHSWYNFKTDKAEEISTLISHFENYGTENLNASQTEELSFTSEEWNAFSEEKKQEILLNYRLAFRAETTVNWCPALGTVLANDEVKDGKSERGGYPVYQKKMMQWSMRITAYSERLLQGLETLDWSEAVKDSQRNWIGKSVGASVRFAVETQCIASLQASLQSAEIEVFTTRPDTIFGVSFLTLAPEHELVLKIVSEEQKQAVLEYIEATSKRSERERMADAKTISGVFTGAYATHPFTGENIPIWISDYVLAGYGTGAVMAVPAGDDRDFAFAKHFNLPIKNIFTLNSPPSEGQGEAAFTEKGNFQLQNSDFLNGLGYKEATEKILDELERTGVGKRKTTYRQRDAIFSRQRYWGEPVPIYYKNNLPYTLPLSALPLELPEVEKYLPTEDGDPPLGRAKKWCYIPPTPEGGVSQIVSKEELEASPSGRFGGELELSTMPGWAGSSWYFLRYMDSQNEGEFVSRENADYWGQVDLYIGGSEHATGHLLYARFWNLFLYDRGLISHKEPFQKMINQGMILGISAFVFRVNGTNKIVSKNLAKDYDTQKIPVDISLIKGNDELDIEGLRNWRPEFKDAEFILENGRSLTPNPSPKERGALQDAENEGGNLTDTKAPSPLESCERERGSDRGEAFLVEREVEKMSKSKYNVVNPDDICEEYGADCLRLYEMFLGPLEQSKPWNTQGLSGVYGFLKKFYNLYFEGDTFKVSEEEPTKEEYKILHTLIKKVQYDIEHFSFNTSVSSFMIAVNDLQKLKCNKRAILEPLAVIISPYAPHICEELWSLLGHSETIEYVPFPQLNEKYLVEDNKEYPVSFNGKVKFKIELPLSLSTEEIEKIVLEDERTIAQLGGNAPKKIIVVPGKIVNIVQ